MIGKHDATYRLYDRNLGEILGAFIAVNGKRQRLAHADIIKRFVLRIGRCHQDTVPVGFLHGDFVTQCFDQIVASLGWKPPKFDAGPVASNGVQSNFHLRC